ncbi:hypothetical protein RJT34_19843 [Clitoria ternatea]|uniref:Uncharacterized protein n=1 Tax=Clitoria ternatea TaxID=43366 RepID=A0AAN9IRS6_CLITE
MWHLLIAAAIAGSTGLVAKHFLTHKALPKTKHSKIETTRTSAATSQSPKHGTTIAKVQLRSSVTEEHRRSASSFKRSKTINNHITPFSSSRDRSLFGWGVGFGIMWMMAGKAEMKELAKNVDKIAKVVEELKCEINRRKPSCANQNLDYVGKFGMESCQMSGRDEALIMPKKTKSELRYPDVKFWSRPLNCNGECGSSVLTDESDPLVFEMDKLEAELEFELQKLPGPNIDTNCNEEIRPMLDEVKFPNKGCHRTDDRNFHSGQYNGISASELNQKLCQLLIEQQKNQIVDLESELNLAQSKLHEKEAELQALKNCVKLLTELPQSTVSGMIVYDESETHKETSVWDSDTVDSESKPSVVGVKRRPVDSESFDYYTKSDSDLYEHTKMLTTLYDGDTRDCGHVNIVIDLGNFIECHSDLIHRLSSRVPETEILLTWKLHCWEIEIT